MKRNLWKLAAFFACVMGFGACANDSCDAEMLCPNNMICSADYKCIDPECNLAKKCKLGMLCNDDAVCVTQDKLFQCGKYVACADASFKCNEKNRCIKCTNDLDCASDDPYEDDDFVESEFSLKTIITNPYENIDWNQVEYVHSFSHLHGGMSRADALQKMGFHHFAFSNYHPSGYIYPLPTEFLEKFPHVLGAPNAEHHSTTDGGGGFHFNSLGSFYTTGSGATPKIDKSISPMMHAFADLNVFDPNIRPWNGVYRLDVNLESVQESTKPAANLTVTGGLEVYRASFGVIGDGVVKERKLKGVMRSSIYFKTLADALNVRLEFDPATTRITLFRLMQGCNRPWRDALRAALDGKLENDAGQRLEGLMFADSGGITINHPAQNVDFLAEILDFDERILGIEVWNASEGFGGRAHEEKMQFYWKWGELLSKGRKCFGFFVKDQMFFDRGRNVLLLPPQEGMSHEEREHEALRAYRQGRFFGLLGAIAVNDQGKEISPYDYSAFRFTNIVIRKSLTGAALGLEVVVSGANKALRPNTQIRFVTDKGTALIVNAENGYFPFPTDANGNITCRYARTEAFAFPSTHLDDQRLTAETLSTMNVAQIANIADAKSPAPTVDMIFSQAIQFIQANKIE